MKLVMKKTLKTTRGNVFHYNFHQQKNKVVLTLLLVWNQHMLPKNTLLSLSGTSSAWHWPFLHGTQQGSGPPSLMRGAWHRVANQFKGAWAWHRALGSNRAVVGLAGQRCIFDHVRQRLLEEKSWYFVQTARCNAPARQTDLLELPPVTMVHTWTMHQS